jgi:hypothetical protein
MTYTFKVWYHATVEGDLEPQTERGLDAAQIEQATGAFLRDMESLGGNGCRRFSVEVER